MDVASWRNSCRDGRTPRRSEARAPNTTVDWYAPYIAPASTEAHPSGPPRAADATWRGSHNVRVKLRGVTAARLRERVEYERAIPCVQCDRRAGVDSTRTSTEAPSSVVSGSFGRSITRAPAVLGRSSGLHGAGESTSGVTSAARCAREPCRITIASSRPSAQGHRSWATRAPGRSDQVRSMPNPQLDARFARHDATRVRRANDDRPGSITRKCASRGNDSNQHSATRTSR